MEANVPCTPYTTDDVIRAARAVKRTREAGRDPYAEMRKAMRREPQYRNESDDVLDVAIAMLVERKQRDRRRGPMQ